MRAKYLLPAIAMLATLQAKADYIFSAEFNSGRIPAVMTAENGTGEAVYSQDYRFGFTDSGWTVAMVQGAGTSTSYAAVSPTHTRTNNPQNNILSCPQVKIEGESPMLRWRARSIYPAFPEAFRVSVLEEGATEPTVIYETSQTPAVWTDYAFDLSEWKGKNVTVSFICVSVNKYMMALDDIFIGDPEESKYISEITSPVFVSYDNGTTMLTGNLSNMGKSLAGGVIVCSYGGGEERYALPEDWKCGDTQGFEFELPLKMNQYTDYKLSVENAQGEQTLLKEGQVFASYFPRTLLVDEFTGMWCNNCPKGQLELQALEQQFGKQIIPLSVHINDMFQCDAYRAGYQVYAVPWMLLNRNSATQGETTRGFSGEYEEPTKTLIEISDYRIDNDDLYVDAIVHWAEDIDNSDDRYRIAYTLTHDFVTEELTADVYQNNSLSGMKNEQYYFLPTRISSDLAPMKDVVISGDFSHTGIPYSLAEKFEAFTPTKVSFHLLKPRLPETITFDAFKEYDLKDCRLVAYIIDTASRRVLNACEQHLDRPAVVSLEFPEVDGLSGEENAEPEYYNLQGMRVANPQSGIFIVRQGTKRSKVVLTK